MAQDVSRVLRQTGAALPSELLQPRGTSTYEDAIVNIVLPEALIRIEELETEVVELQRKLSSKNSSPDEALNSGDESYKP